MQKTFEHGGKIEEFAKSLTCKSDEIIDLSSNINFIKPKITIDFNSLNIQDYPTYENLYESIAKNYKVKSNQLELFNGGSVAIFKLFSFLNLKHCTIYSPAYLEYKKAATLFDYKTTFINRFDDNFLNSKVKKNSLVVFVNPSTPDGRYYDLKKLIKSWIKRDATILIDESFLDFAQKQSALKYLKSYDKLYILKSMTKFYSSAGIRVGTLISSSKNIQELRKNEAMWKLSVFDSTYLQNALEDSSFKNKALKKNGENKKLLKILLKRYSFIQHIYKSDANFFLIKLKGLDALSLQETLKKHKIMIRDCSNFDFLDSSYVRIAVKNKKSIRTLKKALDEVLGEVK